ncbi:hypothetical protein B0H10DRAFT_2013309 [Mycena sp. CBHHK59/15]|nr:hypothetical protein B0H10DRAFT_2013309 [Mycena sp. CBHHK59/15]
MYLLGTANNANGLNFLTSGQSGLVSDLFSGHSGGAEKDSQFTNLLKVIAQWVADTFAAIGAWFPRAWAATMQWGAGVASVALAGLCDAGAAVDRPLQAHPLWALACSGMIFLGPQLLILPLLIVQGAFFIVLTFLGFGISGIIGGSPAALYQSLCYGGNTPASSLFAIMQSLGTQYHAVTLSNWVLAIIRLLAGVVFVYVVLGMTVFW